jgi:microcompartment protein CcmL/EutN
MQANLAIAFIETSSIAKGIEASDAMCKMAEVKLHKTAVIPRGKYIILVSGPVGEVESALRAGLDVAGKTVIHHFIIQNVHQQVLDALDKRVAVERLEAVGIIETKEAAPAFHAADAAAKAAAVTLLEVRAMGAGGKGWVTMTGEVGAVRSAVGAGIKMVPEDMLVSHVVIPLAHEQLLESLTK